MVRGIQAVEEFFPLFDQACNYLIGVSAACFTSHCVLHSCSVVSLCTIPVCDWSLPSDLHRCMHCLREMSVLLEGLFLLLPTGSQYLLSVSTWCNLYMTCQQSMQTQWSLPNTYYMTCCFCSAVPDYAKIRGNTTHTVSTNPITGLSDVTFTYTVTSHWSSLAVVKSVYGQLNKRLTSYDTVVDALERLFTDPISLLVSALCSTFWLCIGLWLVVCCAGMCMYTSMPCKALPNAWFPFLFWLWMYPGLVIVVKSTVKYTCRVALG